MSKQELMPLPWFSQFLTYLVIDFQVAWQFTGHATKREALSQFDPKDILGSYDIILISHF